MQITLDTTASRKKDSLPEVELFLCICIWLRMKRVILHSLQSRSSSLDDFVSSTQDKDLLDLSGVDDSNLGTVPELLVNAPSSIANQASIPIESAIALKKAAIELICPKNSFWNPEKPARVVEVGLEDDFEKQAMKIAARIAITTEPSATVWFVDCQGIFDSQEFTKICMEELSKLLGNDDAHESTVVGILNRVEVVERWDLFSLEDFFENLSEKSALKIGGIVVCPLRSILRVVGTGTEAYGYFMDLGRVIKKVSVTFGSTPVFLCSPVCGSPVLSHISDAVVSISECNQSVQIFRTCHSFDDELLPLIV